MSYLSDTRLHFSGYFQSDVSTVNNDVRHFDSENFLPNYQKMKTPEQMNGWWNPEGGAAFRFVQCQITSGVLNGQRITNSSADPAIGKILIGADGRVAGKMVDLDPQQQSVSEIWGFQLRMIDPEGAQYMSGDYAVAAFMNLWRRQQGGAGGGDQTLASCYTSVLENLAWNNDQLNSPLLSALEQQSNGALSINFNVFGYNMDATSPDFTLGRIVGTIGPALENEPKRFILGRQMMATMSAGPVSADQNIYNFSAQVNAQNKSVTIDLGNSLPITDGDGTQQDIGELAFGVLKDPSIDNGTIINADGIALLGDIPYLDPGWYPLTAGVVDFSFSDNQWINDNIHSQPLAVVSKLAEDRWKVMIRESIDGVHVRADQYVYRLNPADQAKVELYATKYGQPLAADITLAPNNSMIGGGGSGKPLDPPVPIPDVGLPANALSYNAQITTDNTGRAELTIAASSNGPGNPRGYIDGQVYGIGYQLTQQPPSYHANPWLFISCLLWDKTDVPSQPKWYSDIQPILQQYGNLYPIMSKHLVDLGNYYSVVEHRSILQFAFSLPVPDPNYMPVTRDLSEAKREMIVQWLKSEGDNGLPIKGDRPQRADAAEISAVENDNDETAATDSHAELGGKTSYLMNLPSKPLD